MCIMRLFSEHAEDEYSVACLLMVFIAVSIPKLARAENSKFKAHLQGETNHAMHIDMQYYFNP